MQCVCATGKACAGYPVLCSLLGFHPLYAKLEIRCFALFFGLCSGTGKAFGNVNLSSFFAEVRTCEFAVVPGAEISCVCFFTVFRLHSNIITFSYEIIKQLPYYSVTADVQDRAWITPATPVPSGPAFLHGTYSCFSWLEPYPYPVAHFLFLPFRHMNSVLGGKGFCLFVPV